MGKIWKKIKSIIPQTCRNKGNFNGANLFHLQSEGLLTMVGCDLVYYHKLRSRYLHSFQFSIDCGIGESSSTSSSLFSIFITCHSVWTGWFPKQWFWVTVSSSWTEHCFHIARKPRCLYDPSAGSSSRPIRSYHCRRHDCFFWTFWGFEGY